MHNSKVGFESSAVCTKATWKLVNICISKISKGEMLDLKQIKVLSIDQHPTAKVGKGANQQANCHSPGQILSLNFCWS